MSGGRDRTTILAERLALVLAIGAANSERQRAQAVCGGAQITLLRALGDGDAGQAAAIAEIEARAALAAAQARVEGLEARLSALDAELAVAAP